MTARNIAYKVLLDIEKNSNYSNIALNKFLKDSKLTNKDRGLATEIVYGVVANKRTLDYMINKKSKIKVKKMNHSVKIILRMGVYQLLYLDRVADYGVIDEAVKMMKKIDRRSSGFVNAILRNISREKDSILDLDDSYKNLAIKYSYEDWIVDRISDQYGKERTSNILAALSIRPRIFLRINRNKLRDGENLSDLKKYIVDRLEKDGVIVRDRHILEEAIEVENFKQIENKDLFKSGYISVQDISSMMVARALNPKKNSKVLDLCAAPGGKSCHIGEMMKDSGSVLACDVFDHKIKLIKAYSNRLGLTNIEACINNAMVLNEDYVGAFDYVVCDVPCSGMGIVRRKPEIKYKKKEGVDSLPKIQRKILDNASKYIKKDGVLIYSTCTIFKEENIELIEEFLKDNKEFKLDSIENLPFERERLDKGYLEIIPDRDDMDGFFICRMKKI